MRVIGFTAGISAALSLTLASTIAFAQPGVPPVEPIPPPKAQPAAPPPQPPPPAAQPAPPPPPAQPAPPPPAQPPAATQPPQPPPPPVAQPTPPPPPPAVVAAPPPVFVPPPSPPPVLEEEEEEPGFAGWHGDFYLREKHDMFRLYPKGRLHMDFALPAGPGVHDVTAADGGNGLKGRLYVRRLRFELAGELLQRFQFIMGVDFGGQALSNANAKTQTAAGSAGGEPTAGSARFAAVQAATNSPAIADAWINYNLSPAINFMFGQEKTVFGMENRTTNNYTELMEHPVATRFGSSDGEIGFTVWGDIGKSKVVSYEAGVYNGDGRNRPQIDNRVDVIGRVVVRPLAGGDSKLVKGLQLGVSGRHGDRDPDYVGYNYQAVTSGQGFTLWDTRYRDADGRTQWIMPSGAQNSFNVEARLPISKLDLRGELYYVANRTREAIDGFQLTNTERLGMVKGVGWYFMVTAWPFGEAFANGDPGNVRPTHLDFNKKPNLKKGLAITAAVSGVDASYDGASREGSYDGNTPGGGTAATDITIRQYSLGLTYWYTRHVRATVEYDLYHTPGSASADNLAVVPGNAAKIDDAKEAHLLHEFGTRLGVQF